MNLYVVHDIDLKVNPTSSNRIWFRHAYSAFFRSANIHWKPCKDRTCFLAMNDLLQKITNQTKLAVFIYTLDLAYPTRAMFINNIIWYRLSDGCHIRRPILSKLPKLSAIYNCFPRTVTKNNFKRIISLSPKEDYPFSDFIKWSYIVASK